MVDDLLVVTNTNAKIINWNHTYWKRIENNAMLLVSEERRENKLGNITIINPIFEGNLINVKII